MLQITTKVKVVSTVSDASIFRVTNAPSGGLVNREIRRFMRETELLAQAIAPVGNALDRLHDGQPVGRYKAGFRGNVTRVSRIAVEGRLRNVTDHASVVEFGRRRTRDRQVFSWSKAYRNVKRGPNRALYRPGPLPRGASSRGYRRVPNPGGIVSTPVTKARKGKKVLTRATNGVARKYGLTPFV